MTDVALQVLDGIEMRGTVNTDDATILEHIRHSVRLQHPQVKPQPAQSDRVCLVGGGPSLAETEHELRALYFEGAKIVTVNGAYQWCVERNYRPSAQIVLDARSTNARFVDPVIPQCRYLLASQCHPETWARVDGRDVWIWHAVGEEPTWRSELNAYYGQCWQSITGGSTVAMRAIALLRVLGFLRMDLFGIDSCWLESRHHAFAQPENDTDRKLPFRVHPTGRPDLTETFLCAPWHVKQLEDFLQMIRVNGHQFLLNIHGRGLLAYALRSAAHIELVDAAASDGVSSPDESGLTATA
jgi:hypothetical protein